jgi:hypothetical protein
MSIHFNTEAADAFCREMTARREALAERQGDERSLFDTVFAEWRDARAGDVRQRLEELTRNTGQISAELEDLVNAMRRQIQAAQEYLEGQQGY